MNIPKDFTFKTIPFEHQLDGIKYGLEHDRWLLSDSMGMGKSKIVIDLADIKKVRHCLIICCKNGLKWNWKRQVDIHSYESCHILGQKQTSHGIAIQGNIKRLEDLNNIDSLPRFIVTNIDTLKYRVPTGEKVERKVKGKLKLTDRYSYPITEKLIELCDSGKIEMIVVDEFHRCFDYETPVITNIGIKYLGDIVENELEVSVLSYNEMTKENEFKPIKNWFKNPVNKKLIELTVQNDDGKILRVKCTDDHKFYTNNRGWVKAKDLTDNDDVLCLQNGICAL